MKSDPDCSDVYNAYDWNADGVINMAEFSIFSHAWLSQAGGNDPNWNSACNLDNTGASADVIDLADLIMFCEDDPQNWLWIACWKTDLLDLQEQQTQQMIMGSSASPASSATVAASESEPISETNYVAATEPSEVDGQTVVQESLVVEEKSIQEQILDLQDSIEFLEKLWQEESDIQQEINTEDWKKFMDAVYQSLKELETLQDGDTEIEELD